MDPDQIEALEQALLAIPEPLALEEARALLDSFGGDDCFGLAWELMHKIETAPQPVLLAKPSAADEWKMRLWRRSNER